MAENFYKERPKNRRSSLDYLRSAAESLGNAVPFVSDETRAGITEDIKRPLQGFTSQWMATDENGNPAFSDLPGVLINPVSGPLTHLAARAMGQRRTLKPPGLVTETVGLPASFKDLYDLAAGNEPPEVPPDNVFRRAQAETTALREGMMRELELDEPHGLKEHSLESAGIMAGQVPVGGLPSLALKVPKAAKYLLGPLSAAVEWFSPTIVPKVSNYAMGTGFGGTLGAGSEYLINEQVKDQLAQLQFDLQKQADEGLISPEELAENEEMLRQLASELGILESPENPKETYVTGGGFAKGGSVIPRRFRAVFDDGEGFEMDAHGETEQEAMDVLARRLAPFYDSEDDARAGMREFKVRPKEIPATRSYAYLFPVFGKDIPEEEWVDAMSTQVENRLAEAGVMAEDIPYLLNQLNPVRDYTGRFDDGTLQVWQLEGPKDVVDLLVQHQAVGESLDDLKALLPEDESTADIWQSIRAAFDPKKGHAKGGRVKPPPDVMALRQRLAQLMSEAGVAGTGKEMVPVEQTDLGTGEPISVEIPPEGRAPMTMSRRSVLKGMRDLAGAAMSPVDPTSLVLKELETAVAPAAVKAVTGNFYGPQLAAVLQNISDNIFEGSEDSVEILASLAEKVKEAPQFERLAPILAHVAELERRVAYDELDWNTPEYLEGWKHGRRQIDEELERIAKSEGIVRLPEEYEDIGGPEYGPKVIPTRGPVFAEPPEGGRQVLEEVIGSYERMGEDMRPEDRETLDELKVLRDYLGPRADAVFAEYWMSNRPGGSGPYQLDEVFEKLKIDPSIMDAIVDAAESHYIQWGSLDDWASADPEARQKYRDLRAQLAKIAEEHPYDSPPEERELMKQYHQTWDDIFPNSTVHEDSGTAYEAEVRARRIRNDLKLDDEEFAKGGSVRRALLRGDDGKPLRLFRGMANPVDSAVRGEPRQGYAAFFSTSPHVAGSYSGTEGAIAPVYVEAREVIDFPVRELRGYPGFFDKFEFDRRAALLKPGQVLRARQAIDYGPRADTSVDPERLYSYPSDIYAIGPGTRVVPGVVKRAKGGKVMKFRGLKERIHRQRLDVARELLSRLNDGTLDDKAFIENDERAKRLADLFYNLEDTEEAEGLAKGGKVPPSTITELRRKLANLIAPREAAVEGTGQELVPVTPPREQVDPATGEPLELDPQITLEQIRERIRAQPQGTDPNPGKPIGTVSRRDVLRGMRDLAGAAISPVKVDPNSILGQLEGEAAQTAFERSLTPMGPAKVSLTKPNLAAFLTDVWGEIFESSDEGSVLDAADRFDQLQGGEGVASALREWYRRMQTDLPEGGYHNPANTSESVDEALRKLNAEMDIEGKIQQFASDQGIMTTVTSSIPGDISSPSNYWFAEPPESGKEYLEALIDDYRRPEEARGWGSELSDKASLAVADEIEGILKQLGDRADSVIAEFHMNSGHHKEFNDLVEAAQKRLSRYRGVDLWDIIDGANNLYIDHGDLGDWVRASPEARAKVRAARELSHNKPSEKTWRAYEDALNELYSQFDPSDPRDSGVD